jgi:hypothetical protein
MLTKNDLQAIKTLIKGEVNPLKDDMSGLRVDMDGLKGDVGELKKDMKGIKSKLNRAAKDIKYMSGKFDEDIVFTRRRVVRIEKHLHLESPKN